MRNIKVTNEGDKLVIVVDASAAMQSQAPLSKSGKTRLLASTEGNATVTTADGKAVKLGLNVYF